MICNLKFVLLFILVLSALISDIKTYKIKNTIIIVFITAGITLNTFAYGFRGLGDSLLGSIFPVLLLLVLFAAKMLGAGDIKVFCSIGALMGLHYVMYCMAFSFIAGGAIALFIMLTGRNFIQRFTYFANYIKRCYLTASIMPYGDFSVKDDGTKMRFSYAVVTGTFLYQIYIFISI